MHFKSSYRTIVAPNASAMTLDGTRTYIVGREQIAIIDPGPSSPQHFDAVADSIGSGVVVSVLLTHSHPDHAEGATEVATAFNAPLRAMSLGTLKDADEMATDAGLIRAVATPGHTPDHTSYLLVDERVVFCGDLMMGGMDTALVARPEGDLRDYLKSLRTIAMLRPSVICPAHGPEFHDPKEAIELYIHHREARLAQVVEGLRDGPLSADALLDQVYGASIDARLRHYAETAIEAYLAYLKAEGTVRESSSGLWSLA